MSKPVLFLLHGVGQHSQEWASIAGGPVHALKQAASRYACFEGRDLEELVELVPIRYDDIFDRLMSQWADQARKLRDLATPLGSSLLDGGLDLLSKADSGHAVPAVGCDVLLYKGFRLFSHRVQLHVALQMAKVIAERTRDVQGAPPRFYVMAHSLGTTVAHDALHRLGAESWQDFQEMRGEDGVDGDLTELAQIKTSGFAPGEFKFDGLFQIANMSRLLHTTTEGPTESFVRPGTGAGACIQGYFNFDHAADPISKVLRFAMPQPWKDSRIGTELEVRHIHDYNIHGYAHYLAHPKVHATVFRQLFRDTFQLAPAEQDAIRSFPDIGTAFAQDQARKLEESLRPWVQKALTAAEPNIEALRLWLDLFREARTLLRMAP
jgi:hypothetical protein